MKKMTNKELIYNLKDIGLEIQDIGFTYNVGNVQDYQTSFITIDIYKLERHRDLGIRSSNPDKMAQSHFKGSLVSDVIERLFFFMKDQGWSLWLDIHLYNDYHYNNGYLSMKNVCFQREYDYYFNIFRNKLEDGRYGVDEGSIRSIKLQFER